MRYDTECKAAADRILTRIHGHLLSLREELEAGSAAAHENNALIVALEAGDPMEIESCLYDIDHADESDE